MLEIPDANRLAKELNETIKDKRINQVIAGKTPHGFAFFSNDLQDYPKYLYGKICGEAKAVGGGLELTIEDYMLYFNDGTNLRYYDTNEIKPDKHQFYLGFFDDSALVITVQMYAGIAIFKPGEYDNPYYLGGKEKPTPLSDEFTFEYFRNIVDDALQNKPSLSLKGLLATEQRIPGLGNGTCQDILFEAKQHPKTKLSKLSDKEIENLYKTVVKVIKAMTEQGGRYTEKNLFGNECGYKTILSNKTYKDPCKVCKGKIIRQAFLGGNIYFCSNCQVEKK